MNNQKIYKKCSLYLILTFILTIISSSCTNEDLSDNNRKLLKNAEDKNLTTFVSSLPHVFQSIITTENTSGPRVIGSLFRMIMASGNKALTL